MHEAVAALAVGLDLHHVAKLLEVSSELLVQHLGRDVAHIDVGVLGVGLVHAADVCRGGVCFVLRPAAPHPPVPHEAAIHLLDG